MPPKPLRERELVISVARSLRVPFAHVVVIAVPEDTGLVEGRV
jgi:hypothetical protein